MLHFIFYDFVFINTTIEISDYSNFLIYIFTNTYIFNENQFIAAYLY